MNSGHVKLLRLTHIEWIHAVCYCERYSVNSLIQCTVTYISSIAIISHKTSNSNHLNTWYISSESLLLGI